MTNPDNLQCVTAVAERAREDSIFAFLLAKFPQAVKKQSIIALHADGLINSEEVTFWFYVFGLGDA